MADRELLLMEAIRRLDTAYCQLWGAVCAHSETADRAGMEVFCGYYREYRDLMDKIVDDAEPVKLTPAAATPQRNAFRPVARVYCPICADPKCENPGGNH